MDSYKILGQVVIAAGGTYQTLYELPVKSEITHGAVGVTPAAAVPDTQTSVSSIIVCNNTGAADTFSIRLKPDSATVVGNQHNLYVGTAIGANGTHALSLGLVLSEGNILEVTCATAGSVSFTAMGVEIT